MTKRLQVLIEDEELMEIRRAAKQRRQSVAEWVRAALRQARSSEAGRPAAAKLQVLDSAVTHDYPTGPIDELLDQIEQGYRGRP
jgi:hypothetical protein